MSNRPCEGVLPMGNTLPTAITDLIVPQVYYRGNTMSTINQHYIICIDS